MPVTILNLNCRSVVNKVEQLEGILCSLDPDIAVLMETWLNEDIYDSEFVPINYRVMRKDRDRRGGGVAILFKHFLQVFGMPDTPGVESVFCNFYINDIKYILGAVYRPPNSAVANLESLREYMYTQLRQADKLILTGDFNLPNVDWSSFSSRSTTNIDSEMIDIAITFDLLQVVKEFTRIYNDSKAVLDLFFVSGNVRDDVSCMVTDGISDHQAVVLSLQCAPRSKNDKIQYYPNFSRADDESVIDTLAFHLDDFKNNNASMNDLWLLFKDYFQLHATVRSKDCEEDRGLESLDFPGDVAPATQA